MTENKLYAQCRKEALEQYFEKQGTNNEIEVCKLTAEIYGMKLLDMIGIKVELKAIEKCRDEWYQYSKQHPIGTTQDLHDHFVREFNKEVG